MAREKKARGKRRKLRNIRNCISKWSQSLPVPSDLSPSYQGYRVYSFDMDKDFGKYRKFPKGKKRKFLQMIINFVKELHDLKTDKEKEYRIFCYLPIPGLNQVHIIIFYSKAALDSFYEGLNHNCGQTRDFTPSENGQFLQNEWGLFIPEQLEVKGIKGNSGYFEAESIWLIGDVN